MLGRGLVHPVDLHHSANPPSHPELLQLLSEDIAARNFDVKSFLREIALSEAYQRDSIVKVQPVDITQKQKEIQTLEAQAEQELEKSYAADEVVTTATETLDAAFAELKPLQSAIDKANKGIADALKIRDAAKAKIDKTNQAVAAQQKVNQLVADAYEKSKAAADALKDDKELASATAVLLKKKETLTAALTKLQETAKAEQADLDKKETSLKATYPAADAAIAAAKPVEEKVRNLRTDLIAKREVAANHREAAAVATQKAEELKTLVEFSQLQSKIETLQRQIPELVSTHKAAREKLPAMMQMVTEKQTVLTAAQQEMQKADGLVKASIAKMGEQKTTATLLNESLTKLNAASERIAGENPLNAAKTEIAASLETLNNTIKEAQAELTQHQATLTSRKAAVDTASSELQATQTLLANQQKNIAELDAKINQSQSELEQAQSQHKNLESKILSQSSDRLNMAEVVQLTPEQLGWSMLIATGQWDRQRAAEAAKLNKEKPLAEEELKDAAKVAAREKAVDEATLKTLSGRIAAFLPLYGASAGQPQHNFFATADQALFLSNGNELKSWLAPVAGNLTDRATKIEDVNELAEELYLTIYCRFPTTEEVVMVNGYLQQRGEEKSAAVQELAWALLTSAEFRFQY